MSRRSKRISKALAKVDHSLSELLGLMESGKDLSASALTVSAWTPGKHIEHAMLAGESVYRVAQLLSTGDGEKPKLRLIGRVSIAFNWIPRGKGKAPDVTQPGDLTIEELRSRLEILRKSFASLDAEKLASCKVGRAHPVFGVLGPRDWLRFMPVHNHHHVKIVRDVWNAAE